MFKPPQLKVRQKRNIGLWTMEFIVVVLGVLLALWAQEFVNARREAVEQRQLLERLASEAEDTVSVVREQRDEFGKMADDQFAALDRWVNTTQCPTEDDWNALARTGFYPALSFPTAAYDEMISSGGLARLPDAAIRKAVSAFHAETRRYERQQDFFRQAILLAETSYAPDPTMRAVVNSESGGIGYDLDEERACRDPANQVQTAMAVRNFGVMQRYRERVAEKAIQMCGAISEALGGECQPSEGGPLSAEDKELAAKPDEI